MCRSPCSRLSRNSIFPFSLIRTVPSWLRSISEPPCFCKDLQLAGEPRLAVRHPNWQVSGQPLSSTFANFRNSLCYRKLQIIPHLFMHFPKSKIHKELGHCPDAGYPKMAKVELRWCVLPCERVRHSYVISSPGLLPSGNLAKIDSPTFWIPAYAGVSPLLSRSLLRRNLDTQTKSNCSIPLKKG